MGGEDARCVSVCRIVHNRQPRHAVGHRISRGRLFLFQFAFRYSFFAGHLIKREEVGAGVQREREKVSHVKRGKKKKKRGEAESFKGVYFILTIYHLLLFFGVYMEKCRRLCRFVKEVDQTLLGSNTVLLFLVPFFNQLEPFLSRRWANHHAKSIDRVDALIEELETA